MIAVGRAAHYGLAEIARVGAGDEPRGLIGEARFKPRSRIPDHSRPVAANDCGRGGGRLRFGPRVAIRSAFRRRHLRQDAMVRSLQDDRRL
jgi:hypothetical protein